MPHCRGIIPARAERRVGHTVHSHYSYLDGAPVWLCPGPSVGFCSSISAICAFLRRLWGPRRRQNDWHFSGTTRGTVPRAFCCQWCALTLTKPERVGGVGGSKQEAPAGNSCTYSTASYIFKLQETPLIPATTDSWYRVKSCFIFRHLAGSIIYTDWSEQVQVDRKQNRKFANDMTQQSCRPSVERHVGKCFPFWSAFKQHSDTLKPQGYFYAAKPDLLGANLKWTYTKKQNLFQMYRLYLQNLEIQL